MLVVTVLLTPLASEETQAQAAPAPDQRLALIMEGHPNYQNFTESDFSSLTDAELRAILASFALKFQPEALIPQSFVRQYGENAAGEFALAIEREATRRGKPELYATAVLSAGLGNASGVRINSDVPATAPLADGSTAVSTAPRILNFQVAQNALVVIARNEATRQQGTYTPQTSFQVSIPQSAIAAVVAAHPQAPQSLATQGFSFAAGDELAYLSGYATRAGAARDIWPITLNYPPNAVCAMPAMRARIFDPRRSNEDAGAAWAAGYIQSDLDQMQAQQRQAVLAVCPSR